MAKLIRKIALISVLTLGPYLCFQYFVATKIDPGYWMLTHKSKSVITGLSRAKRIVPKEIQAEIPKMVTLQNLSSNKLHTPYGKPYLNWLRKKVLASESRDALHIVVVSPQSVMDLTNEPEEGREAGSLMYKMNMVNSPVNFEYMLRQPAVRMAVNRWLTPMIMGNKKAVHTAFRDGHIASTLPEGHVMNRLKSDESYIRSKRREAYLKRTIEFLRQTGEVIVVRMPISEEMLAYEMKVFPFFDSWIGSLTNEMQLSYLDYSRHNDELEFYDLPGHHLVQESARKFSRKLGADIKAILAESDAQ